MLRKSCLFLLWLCSVNSAFAGERILALAPHACEILYAIGAEKDVVGAVSYCDFPEQAKHLPRVGSYNRINVEAAILLQPTLAIVLDTKTPGVDQLRALGVKVVQSYPKHVDEVLTDIRRLGLLVGHQQQANELADALQKRLDDIGSQVGDRQVPVFYEIWAEPLLTAGQNTFIHDVLLRMGLRNVFGHVALEAPRVNVESVITASPEIVVIPSEKRDVAARTFFWKKWLGDDIRVITINPDLMHRPGPRLLDGMEFLLKELDKEQMIEH